jgi:hypothetical protein
MQLTLEAVDPDALDLDRLAEGMRRIEGIVPAPDFVDVVIAGDFISAVRSRVADAEYARQYNTDRLHGTAVAKAIPQEDGRISIVFAAGLVDKRVDAGLDTERLFAHEGQHAAIDQRSETLSDIRIRQGLDIYSHRGYFAWVAGRASEEYRVERALCDEGCGLRRATASRSAMACPAFERPCSTRSRPAIRASRSTVAAR